MKTIVLPNEPNRCNCVLFARGYVKSLPFGLWTLGDKKKTINSYVPNTGAVAVMNCGWWGHVGLVTKVDGNQITIKEANYQSCKITQRTGNATELKIVGYYDPKPKPVEAKECYGIDISHWQGVISWPKVKTDFVIMKVSQGDNMWDTYMKSSQAMARQAGILCGYYHFADGGKVVEEVDNFLGRIGEIKEGELLVLDWEISHPSPDMWCKEFIDRVKAKTGIIPILYTNEARVKSINWQSTVKTNCGLWVAKYGTNNGKKQEKPSSGKWPFWMMWQYTSRGTMDGIKGHVDLNYCPMSLGTLKKYGKK